MTHTEKLALLAEWQASMETADHLIEPVAEVLLLSPESPIHTAMWSLQSAYTKAVSRLVGDHADWLAWYAHENDFGRKGMEAGPKDGMRPIVTLEDLLWVMEVEA